MVGAFNRIHRGGCVVVMDNKEETYRSIDMKLLLRCIVFSVVIALVIAVSIWLLFTVLGGEQTFCWGVSWRLSCIVFGLVLVYSLANIHDDAA